MLGMSVAGIAGLGIVGVPQQTGGTAAIRLGGKVQGWQPLDGFEAPYVGQRKRNPTLNLTAGTTYRVFWRNLDGLPHNVAILDENEDVLKRTEIVSEQGATQTLTFTATADMATYLCQVHPVQMRGDISFGSDDGESNPEKRAATSAFFEPGPTVDYETVAEGMTAPTDFAQPPDGNEAYVTDQTGTVWVVTDQGRQDEPFVDIGDRMVELGTFNGSYAKENQEYDERGLLGIAFHPDYGQNQRFYLHYSAPPNENTPDGWDHVEVVSEFTANSDGTSGQPDSETKLLQIQHPQYNHDAGPITFGPDGNLYVPMGDGGGANDDMYGHVDDWYERNSGGNGQDVEKNLMGDVLRIDVDGQDGDKQYAIPDSNPFAGKPKGRGEIWAYGLRNPFGIDFDSEGNCFVGMAGQNLWESAWTLEAGSNCGWNVTEGSHCFSTENPSDSSAITDCPQSEPDSAPFDGSAFETPIVEYPHTYQGSNVGITIIGGKRYENDTIGDLQGAYVFGDWTRDPARTKPQGRVLMAMPPEDFGSNGGSDAQSRPPSGGQGSTTTTQSSDGGQGPQTPTETATATPSDGKSGSDQQAGSDQQSGSVVPRGQLWDMAEVQFQREFDYFVRQFGQDRDGGLYVLVSKQGVPKGDTGAVLKLVPADTQSS